MDRKFGYLYTVWWHWLKALLLAAAAVIGDSFVAFVTVVVYVAATVVDFSATKVVAV